MRVPYTLTELIDIYERLVIKAMSLYELGRLSECINCIQSAAEFQYNLNNIYTDRRLEMLIKNISNALYKKNTTYQVTTTVFFYDSFCLDNRGLTQHYLDALVNDSRYKVVYILENDNTQNGNDIIAYLNYHNVKIEVLPAGSPIEKSKFLYELICIYRPTSALFHLTPYTVIPFLSFYPFKDIIKYQINLTDHAFWLGNKDFFNFLYEFRNYGIVVSQEKRGYNKSQLILNHYYPWQSGALFQGFPIKTEGKTILLSGGAMYKIEGDNDMYFTLLKELLNTFPEILIFYAGGGNDTHLRKFIDENNYHDRLILLGNRVDIDALFKNCDIYISTYPIGGGLMSQYAAINSKPILLYKSKEIEKLICTKEYRPYALESIDDFLNEAGKLIRNKDYRESRGKFFRDMLLGKNDFRERFSKTFMDTNFKSEEYCHEEIDYDYFTGTYVERINNNSFGFIEKALIKRGVFNFKIIMNSFLQIPQYFRSRFLK